jgi:hypothetical protein
MGEWQGDLFVAFELFIEDGHQPPPPPGDQVAGTVVNIDPDAMMLFLSRCQGEVIPVQVTPETIIMGEQGPMMFEDIQIDMFAFGMGEWQGDLFVAFELFIEDGHQPPPPPGDQVAGTVVNIDPDAMMLFLSRCQGEVIPVQVTPETIIMGEQGPMMFEDIQIDMFAFGMGEWQGDLFVAFELYIEGGHQPPPPPPGIVEGNIEDIDYETHMLFIGCCGAVVPVQVTEMTELMGEQGPITFDDIVVGMYAMAMGTYEGDILIADHIMVMQRW